MDLRTPYSLTLTRAEYADAVYMTARGYLGEVTDHATAIDENLADAGEAAEDILLVLRFSEPAAWVVRDVCEADPHAVWALTSPGTSLGRKFADFLDAIV